MPKHFFLMITGGMLLSACVPGPELSGPPVEGIVTDARTHRPVPGALVTVAKTTDDLPVQALPNALSDPTGHFTLFAHYKLGIVLIYGDPMITVVTVHVRHDGYRPLDLRETYNFYVPPFTPLRVEAALEPELPQARAKNRSTKYIIP